MGVGLYLLIGLNGGTHKMRCLLYTSLAFLLSDVAEKYAEILSASMTFEVGQIASLPIIYRDEEKSNIVNKIGRAHV